MSPLVVCVAVILHRCRRPVDGADHLDDAPPIAFQVDCRRDWPMVSLPPAERRVVPIDKFYDWMVDAAAGLQSVLNRRPSQTASMALRFGDGRRRQLSRDARRKECLPYLKTYANGAAIYESPLTIPQKTIAAARANIGHIGSCNELHFSCSGGLIFT